MIKPIMRMELFLQQPSAPATEEDFQVGCDLLDTLAAHSHECVGMAANMIGVRKRIIVFTDSSGNKVRNRLMYNPEIVHAVGEYETQEGCLSLLGQRPTKRFKRIKVSYLDESFKPRTEAFDGFVAQIIQHEIDHCNGIII